MLANWDWILFDADDTLFHFDAFAGLQQLFRQYDVAFSAGDYADYQAINKPLWVEYQNGAISALQLQHQRFTPWAERLNVTPDTLNSGFLNAMAEICVPLKGAVNLIERLKGEVKMGIITNGFTALQQARLQRTGFLGFFDLLVISEQVGVAKPHPDIFNHALEKMGHPPRDRVLMVGDNPDSDILGGINAGLKTCWLNADGRSKPEQITPDWEVASLHELETLLFA
ncbi:noncanonical pyrimidine nucleotidase, YjjG family [Duffyella gerundensis]|jgi:5'-nucleotidase|uniref:Pyrimidine 5'-nucleotidase YjjG n=1 Tax=Duffyella gerundensis TaxID=1619313 RepID=A0A0U5GI83_9GAMM|nr:pyrimidine 5'-nucleotidase [Duffyella gerundensis]QTO53703.1 pyrimidine 5'-nucleotidase [Duffyella gerundensis]UCB32220.1 noncanonical pyrimidine nucleotidase, YjjG family [Duffyella gerundensis]CUU22865.1 Pyrimidine 5'-nucleotidase YjjG [Duffyella gerundensis]